MAQISRAKIPFELPPNISINHFCELLHQCVQLSRSFDESKKLAKAIVIGNLSDIRKWCAPWSGSWSEELMAPLTLEELMKYGKEDGALAVDALSKGLIGKVMFAGDAQFMPQGKFSGGTRHRSAFVIARTLAVHSGGLAIVVSEGGTLDVVKVFVYGFVYLYNGLRDEWFLSYDENGSQDLGRWKVVTHGSGTTRSVESTSGSSHSESRSIPSASTGIEPVDLLIVFTGEGLGASEMEQRCEILMANDRLRNPLSWHCIDASGSSSLIAHIRDYKPRILHIEPGEGDSVCWPSDDVCKDEQGLQRQIIISCAGKQVYGAIINFGCISPSAVEVALDENDDLGSLDSLSIVGWSLRPDLRKRKTFTSLFYQNLELPCTSIGFRQAYVKTIRLMEQHSRALFLVPRWESQKLSHPGSKMAEFFFELQGADQNADVWATCEIMFEAQQSLIQSTLPLIESSISPLEDQTWIMEVVLKTSPNIVQCLPDVVTAASLRELENNLQEALPIHLRHKLRVRRFRSVAVCMAASDFQKLLAVLSAMETRIYVSLPVSWGGGEVLVDQALPGAGHWLYMPCSNDRNFSLMCKKVQNLMGEIFNFQCDVDAGSLISSSAVDFHDIGLPRKAESTNTDSREASRSLVAKSREMSCLHENLGVSNLHDPLVEGPAAFDIDLMSGPSDTDMDGLLERGRLRWWINTQLQSCWPVDWRVPQLVLEFTKNGGRDPMALVSGPAVKLAMGTTTCLWLFIVVLAVVSYKTMNSPELGSKYAQPPAWLFVLMIFPTLLVAMAGESMALSYVFFVQLQVIQRCAWLGGLVDFCKHPYYLWRSLTMLLSIAGKLQLMLNTLIMAKTLKTAKCPGGADIELMWSTVWKMSIAGTFRIPCVPISTVVLFAWWFHVLEFLHTFLSTYPIGPKQDLGSAERRCFPISKRLWRRITKRCSKYHEDGEDWQVDYEVPKDMASARKCIFEYETCFDRQQNHGASLMMLADAGRMSSVCFLDYTYAQDEIKIHAQRPIGNYKFRYLNLACNQLTRGTLQFVLVGLVQCTCQVHMQITLMSFTSSGLNVDHADPLMITGISMNILVALSKLLNANDMRLLYNLVVDLDCKAEAELLDPWDASDSDIRCEHLRWQLKLVYRQLRLWVLLYLVCNVSAVVKIVAFFSCKDHFYNFIAFQCQAIRDMNVHAK